jgi:hypothetical protein
MKSEIGTAGEDLERARVTLVHSEITMRPIGERRGLALRRAH